MTIVVSREAYASQILAATRATVRAVKTSGTGVTRKGVTVLDSTMFADSYYFHYIVEAKNCNNLCVKMSDCHKWSIGNVVLLLIYLPLNMLSLWFVCITPLYCIYSM